jgi:hypothetical protein
MVWAVVVVGWGGLGGGGLLDERSSTVHRPPSLGLPPSAPATGVTHQPETDKQFPREMLPARPLAWQRSVLYIYIYQVPVTFFASERTPQH